MIEPGAVSGGLVSRGLNKSGGGFPQNLPSKQELQEAMEDIWSSIVYIERGRKFSTIVVGFGSEKEAQMQASRTRQTRTHNLVPEYCGRRSTRIDVRNISHDVKFEFNEVI